MSYNNDRSKEALDLDSIDNPGLIDMISSEKGKEYNKVLGEVIRKGLVREI